MLLQSKKFYKCDLLNQLLSEMGQLLIVFNFERYLSWT